MQHGDDIGAAVDYGAANGARGHQADRDGCSRGGPLGCPRAVLARRRPGIDDQDGLALRFDAEGEPLSGNALVWALAKELNKPERRAIHLTKAEASVLHRHPAWRICCGEYGENREQFKADWEYIRQVIASAMPSAAGSWPTYSDAITYKQGREALNAAIQEFGD